MHIWQSIRAARCQPWKDGDTVIAESAAILAYLDSKHPEPPIFGTNAAEMGHVWQLLQEVDFFLQQPIQAMIRPIFFGQMPEKADEVKAMAPPIHDELARVETRLGQSQWLAGAAISAADLALLPAVQGILRAMMKDEAVALDLGFVPLAERYPDLAAWIARMEALPGYDNAFPPHWK